jgi:LacI family transcriptional regulator
MSNITIKDIARIANVSYATVSRALSGSPGVSKETRNKILKICNDVGYTPNYIARSMVAKKTKLIGLIVTDVSNPFMSEMAFNIEQIARELGYHIMLCNSVNNPKQEEDVFKLLIGRKVDGILIFPTNSQSHIALKKYLDKIPVVFVSEFLDNYPVSYVSVNNYLGTAIAAEYLYSLGHRNILYFGRRKVAHNRRYDGYVSVCKKYNLTPHCLDSSFPTDAISYGYQIAIELFKDKNITEFPYTGIIASTDSNALGLMQAADELGIAIPEDISVIGFDNIPYSGLPKIMLTTIEQPYELMAKAAVEMLIDKINQPNLGYSHKILTPKLIIRNSCRELGS